MSNITPKYLSGDVVPAGISGNAFRISKTYDTEVDSAIVIADVLRIVKMPAWTRPTDLSLKSNAVNALVTVKVGIKGVDDASLDDDDCLILAATALATATRIRANSGVPIPVIPFEYYIAITFAGGGVDATKLEAIVDYEYDPSGR